MAYLCQHCDKRFSSKSSLARHQRIHTGEKPHTCPQCKKRISLSSNLASHMRIHGEKPYTCTQCSKCFSESGNLAKHMWVHTGEKPYPCVRCNKRFSQSCHLTSHMRIHTGEKPYPCVKCNKRFSRSDSHARHMRVHTGEKPHTCPQCQKRFSLSYHLASHMKIHTGEKPYTCTQCSKCFSESGNLAKHIWVHTGEKPYPCPQCQKRFSASAFLITHMRIHTGEKPYPCVRCNKRFSQSCHLTIHMRIHTGEKPYPCVKCNKRFSRSDSHARHMRVHTGEKNFPRITQCNKRFSQTVMLASCKNVDKDMSESPCLSSKPFFPLLPQEDVVLDDGTKPLEINEDGLTNFQTGYYLTTLVTLAILPAATALDTLSWSQPCLHPNITMFYGVTLMPGCCQTIVMENVNTPLSYLLDETGVYLSIRERLDIAVGCVSAVDYLHHQLGVSHGMLTCDYVFCSSSFAAKVLHPTLTRLIDGNATHTSNAIQDDIRHLGHILLALFRDVIFEMDPDVCDESGECCEQHRLHAALCLMVNEDEADVDSIKKMLCALEGMRQTQQYRQCPAKRVLFE